MYRSAEGRIPETVFCCDDWFGSPLSIADIVCLEEEGSVRARCMCWRVIFCRPVSSACQWKRGRSVESAQAATDVANAQDAQMLGQCFSYVPWTASPADSTRSTRRISASISFSSSEWPWLARMYQTSRPSAAAEACELWPAGELAELGEPIDAGAEGN